MTISENCSNIAVMMVATPVIVIVANVTIIITMSDMLVLQ